MTDPITDERLREMANGATIYGHERNAIAAELLAARNKIRADEEHLPTIGRLTQDLYETEQELAAARADLAAAARVLPPCCGSLVDAAQKLVDERDEARAEVAATDAAISDRGVPEYDCRLPLAERVDNLLADLKDWRFQFATTAMENEQLRADLRKTIKLIGDAWACQEPGDWQNEAWELIEKYRYLS